jgi:hypothetical protein
MLVTPEKPHVHLPSRSQRCSDPQAAQMMSPTELLQQLGNLPVDERTGERDHFILFELYTQGSIDAQMISNWLECVEIGQMGHFLGLKLNVRSTMMLNMAVRNTLNLHWLWSMCGALSAILSIPSAGTQGLLLQPKSSKHKPEYATYVDHVEHYSPQFANTQTTESEIDEMQDCLLKHRAHALNQPWRTYDYEMAIENSTGIGSDRCWSCYRCGSSMQEYKKHWRQQMTVVRIMKMTMAAMNTRITQWEWEKLVKVVKVNLT